MGSVRREGYPASKEGEGTKHRTAEKPIREQSLLERSEQIAAVGSWVWTPATGEIQWSENLFRIFGFEPDEVAPSIDLSVELVHPSDRERFLSALATVPEQQHLPPMDYRIVLADMSVRHLRGVSAYIDDDEHGNIQLAGTVQDLTEQLRADRESAAISSISRVLADWQSLEVGGAELLRGLTQAMEFDASALWVPRADVLVAAVMWSEPSGNFEAFETATCQTYLAPGVGLPGRVWRERVVIESQLTSEMFARKRLQAAREAGLVGALAFPALHDTEVLAVLEFCCREPQELTPRLRESLVGIGHQVGQFLDRRRGDLGPSLLTPRETQILQLAANGKSGPGVAAELTISTSTVKAHFEHIHQKLGVGDRASAVASAIRLGLIK